MIFFTKCLLCGSEKLEILSAYAKDNLCKCKNCDFVFARKIPTYTELIEEYSKYPRSNTISDITLRRYDEWLRMFDKYRSTNNIIDVGAGDGQFIGRAKLFNWNTYATEFDDTSVELCSQKGAIVHKGKLQTDNYPPNFFDVIVSIEVLEHINNPVEEVEGFHKILRSGGLVYVTTPNLNSISHRLLKSKWNIFHYPEHLCYYTPKTLEKVFVEAGFQKVSVETTGFSPQRFYQSKGEELVEGKKDEGLRTKTETRFWWKIAKRAINTMLNITGMGDAMKGTFRKI